MTELNQLNFKHNELRFVPIFIGFAAASVLDFIERLLLRVKKLVKPNIAEYSEKEKVW